MNTDDNNAKLISTVPLIMTDQKSPKTEDFVLSMRVRRCIQTFSDCVDDEITTINTQRRTKIHDLQVAFKFRYVFNFITKLYRRQAEVIQNHEQEYVHNIGQYEAIQ